MRSVSGSTITSTRSPTTSTRYARTSSAHGSSVPPDARSKRAWCQWHVSSRFSTVPLCRGKPMWGQRSSTAKGSPSLQTTQMGCEPILVVMKPSASRSASAPASILSLVMVIGIGPYDLKCGSSQERSSDLVEDQGLDLVAERSLQTGGVTHELGASGRPQRRVHVVLGVPGQLGDAVVRARRRLGEGAGDLG